MERIAVSTGLQTTGIRTIAQQQVVTQPTAAISPCAIRRIIQLSVPIRYADIVLTDADGKDVTALSMYSWSTDSVCWTEWVTYPQYQMIARSIESDYYLRILIFSSVGVLKIGGLATECYSICLDSQNQFLVDFCGNPNLFDPYANLDCALALQQQLSDTVICMLGIPAYYFRVLPDADTADWTFKEYILHSVESVKYIKLMCEDGALPSSRPQMTEFDFDWDNDWEVEMSKTAFASAFGDTAFPKQRDLIYVPMMKRMYEVNSAYDEKNEGLMWRSTTWKLALVKYNEKDNVSHGSYEGLIDTLVENQYMDMWKGIEENEQVRQSGYGQTQEPTFAATNLYNIFDSDSIRIGMTSNIDISEKQTNQGAAVVTRNMYLGKTVDDVVKYQKPYCGEDGTLIVQLYVPSGLELSRIVPIGESGESETVLTNIATAGEISIDCGTKIVKEVETFRGKRIESVKGVATIGFGGMQYPIEISPSEGKNLIVCCRWKKSNFTSDITIYENKCRTEDPIGKLKPTNWFYDFTSPLASMVEAYNEDYYTECGAGVEAHPYPVGIGYLKLYNTYLDNKRVAVEATKYSTTEDDCLINDLARPILSDHGYNVR